MENLFKFATKELSQDAFLRWLFESYKDEKVRPVLDAFVEFLTGNKINIMKIKTEAQHKQIDVVVTITTENGTNEYIFFEDKTYSHEHNQLLDYNNVIAEYTKNDDESKQVYKIFYKTSIVNEREIDRVNYAKWKLYDINKISQFWEQYVKHNVNIISWYSQHIVDVKKKYSNTDFDATEDLYYWLGYFKNVLYEKIKGFDCWFNTSYFGYSYFNLRPYGDFIGQSCMPYLEIRSRDINKEISNKHKKMTFDARILTYGMEWCYTKDSIESIKASVRKTIGNNLYGFSPNGRDKQLAHKVVEFDGANDFADKILETAKEFSEIMNASNISITRELYYKDMNEKVDILTKIKELLEVKKKELAYYECGCWNTETRKRKPSTYCSLYVNLEEDGLTIEPYLMLGPSNKEYERDNILYIAVWDRKNKKRDFDFSKVINPNECIEIKTSVWGKHYILKEFDLVSKDVAQIVKEASKYIIEQIKLINQKMA